MTDTRAPRAAASCALACALCALPARAPAQAPAASTRGPRAASPYAPLDTPPAPVVLPAERPALPPALALPFEATVARAMARNPGTQTAQAEIRRAEALLQEIRSASLPSVTAIGTYTGVEMNRGAQGVTFVPMNQVNGNITVSVPLVAPIQWAAWSHAHDDLNTARLSADAIRRQVAASTAHAYIDTLLLHREVDALVTAVAAARAHYDVAHQLYARGAGNRLDELRSAQEVALDQQQLQDTVALLIAQREALGILLGASGPVDTAGEVPVGPLPPEPLALRDAAVRRTDVLAAAERVIAARHRVRDSWVDYLPTVSAVGYPFLQTPSTFTLPSEGWQIQAVLSVPLFDGGLRLGWLHERQALETEARIALDATERQARADVRASLESVRHADEALAAARERARLTREALELANLGYNAGATGNLVVIDSERDARDAAIGEAQAEDFASRARIDALLASGRWP